MNNSECFYINDLMTTKNMPALAINTKRSLSYTRDNNRFISGDATSININVVINDNTHLSRLFNFGHADGVEFSLSIT